MSLPYHQWCATVGTVAHLALSEWMLQQYADERLRGLLLSLDPRIMRGQRMYMQPHVRLCKDDKGKRVS